MFNFNSPDQAKHQLYNDVRFRRAMSVAINRAEINELIYKRSHYPSQVCPAPGPPYHGESDLFKAYTAYDPELANEMLDEIGITARGSSGFRLGPDGKELRIVMYANTGWPSESPEVMELVKGYFEDVGIAMSVKPEAGPLWFARHSAGKHDMSCRGAHFGGTVIPPTLNANTCALSGWQWAPEWALWLDTNGADGVEPPEGVKRIRELHEMIMGEPEPDKRIEMTMEIFEIHMENLWSIGIVRTDPSVPPNIVLNKKVKNCSATLQGFLYAYPVSTWFIDD